MVSLKECTAHAHAQIACTKQTPVSAVRAYAHKAAPIEPRVCARVIICMPISGHPVLSVTKRYRFHCLVWNSMEPQGMPAQ